MTGNKFTYLPRALAHDFDWAHMHWSAQWLYVTIQQSRTQIIPSVFKWDTDLWKVQAQALTEDMILAAAEELASAGFLMVDEASRECHLRRFLEFDNLVKYPNTLVGLANDLTKVGSWEIRSAVVTQLRALRDVFPDLSGWSRTQVAEVMLASYGVPEFAWINERSKGEMPFVLPDAEAEPVPETE